MLDPLPYPEAERLVRLTNRVPGWPPDERWHLSRAQYLHLAERSQTIEAIGRVGVDAQLFEGFRIPPANRLQEILGLPPELPEAGTNGELAIGH